MSLHAYSVQNAVFSLERRCTKRPLVRETSAIFLSHHQYIKIKKTLLLLAVVGCTLSVSDAATPLYFSSVEDNNMLNVSAWGYFWNLHSSATPASNTNIYAANPIYKGTFNADNPCDTSDADDMSNGVYNAILTEGNTDYDLVLSGSSVNLEVGSAVYFEKVTPGTTAPTAITLLKK